MNVTETTNKPSILLGSSSRYRAALLNTLGLKFTQASPNIDESSGLHEDAKTLCRRLSINKSMALLNNYTNHVIISSDQCAQSASGQLLGKPGSIDKAIKQLSLLSDTKVVFYTSLCVLSAIEPKPSDSTYINVEAFTFQQRNYFRQVCVEKCEVKFRNLSMHDIKQYVSKENALDCAGSFKAEGLGISLFEYIRSDDPNILIGLPLIATCTMLKNLGIDIL